jgi:hypothetical protein
MSKPLGVGESCDLWNGGLTFWAYLNDTHEI